MRVVFHSISFTCLCDDGFYSTDKTINAEYAIDPARNGGLEFQYDEVARTKEDRRRLDAGDCECCRDVSLIRSIRQVSYYIRQ